MELIIDIDSRKLVPKFAVPGIGMPAIPVLFAGDYPVKMDLFLCKNGKRVLIATGEVALP